MNRKYVIAILISVLLLASAMSSLFYINLYEKESTFAAKNGALELSRWDEKEKSLIDLDGVWEFYPGVLITPAEEPEDGANGTHDPFDGYKELKKYIKVPGTWGPYLNEDQCEDGSGTYRLIVKVPEDGTYGIKTGTIRLASRIYMNGKEVARMGNIALDRSGFQPASKYKIGFTHSVNREIELVLQISSYTYHTGGILQSIEFGSFDSIMKQNNISRALDGLVISVCLAAAFYFFLQWLQRRYDRYLLYFSGSALFLGIYLSTMNEQLLDLIFDYDLSTRLRIQIAMMIMVTFSFFKFIQHFFGEYKKNKLVNALSILLLSLLLFLFRDIVEIGFTSAGVTQASIVTSFVATYGCILWILSKSIYRKEDSAEYILVLMTCLLSYWIVIALKVSFEMETGQLPVFLIISMMISISLMMSHRLQLDHQRAKMLAGELLMNDEMKDDFLVKTSHELRTPLHVIINLTRLLIEGKKGVLNTEQLENLFYIHQESQRLAHLVDDLMDASLIEKGEISIKPESFDAYWAVENLVYEMRLLIPESKQLTIHNQIPEDFPAIKVDRDRFKQIIYNLLHNAIKFTEGGKITVTASTKGGKAEIKIADTGIGIKEEYLGRIFDSHYKGKAEEEMVQGYGIGLSVVKHLVEIHGGEVGVTSAYKEGSVFYFTLPLYVAESHVQNVLATPPRPVIEKVPKLDGSAHTILIVDDEGPNQKVLYDIVSQMGNNALVAGSGKDALSILGKNEVDLVILDIMLPDMSGDLICERIRNNYSMTELPILILTASGRGSDLMKSFQYGANDFQKKPANKEELESRIRSLLLMKASVDEGLNKEFQYFYSQISPHFLYNTLNTVIGLSYKDHESVRKALLNLATYLRGKMDFHRQKSMIPLESELELVMAYLEIEQMRYMDRLSVEWDVEEGVKAMVPPLALQPLVENAVRHGLVSQNNICIEISVKRVDDNFISIGIMDNGPGMDPEKQQELVDGCSERLGFTNVMKRINMMRGASIALYSKPDEGTRIVITVPEVRFDESDSG